MRRWLGGPGRNPEACPAGSVKDTAIMPTIVKTIALFATLLCSLFAFEQNATRPNSDPDYTSDAQLKFPEHYREWVYLSSGFDMSYNPGAMRMSGHAFDNVFVNPEAYRVFVKTGTWPDKTMLVLEVRSAEEKGSINKAGHYQSTVNGG